MIALAAVAGLFLARNGGLLISVGDPGERRLGWVMCGLAVACGFIAGHFE